MAENKKLAVAPEAKWVDEKTLSACPLCKKEFSLFTRKHHCRFCGNVICKSCGDTNTVVALDGTKGLLACSSCVETSKLAATVAKVTAAVAKSTTAAPSGLASGKSVASPQPSAAKAPAAAAAPKQQAATTVTQSQQGPAKAADANTKSAVAPKAVHADPNAKSASPKAAVVPAAAVAAANTIARAAAVEHAIDVVQEDGEKVADVLLSKLQGLSSPSSLFEDVAEEIPSVINAIHEFAVSLNDAVSAIPLVGTLAKVLTGLVGFARNVFANQKLILRLLMHVSAVRTPFQKFVAANKSDPEKFKTPAVEMLMKAFQGAATLTEKFSRDRKKNGCLAYVGSLVQSVRDHTKNFAEAERDLQTACSFWQVEVIVSGSISGGRGGGIDEDTIRQIVESEAKRCEAAINAVTSSLRAVQRLQRDTLNEVKNLETHLTSIEFTLRHGLEMKWSQVPATRLKLEYTSVLGEGAQAVVVQGTLDGSRRVAVKLIRPQVIGDQELLDEVYREASILSSYSHPHIIEFVGVSRTDKELRLVSELADCSLGQLVHETSPGTGSARRLKLASLLEFGLHLTKAMAYLHERGVVHRDIKPDNALVLFPATAATGTNSKQGAVAKLADFGKAKGLTAKQRAVSAAFTGGTPSYTAPEVLRGSPASPASDVYSFGVTLWEIATGLIPFADETLGARLIGRIVDGATVDVRLIADVRLRSLVRSCLDRNPQSRPTAAALSRSLQRLLEGSGDVLAGGVAAEAHFPTAAEFATYSPMQVQEFLLTPFQSLGLKEVSEDIVQYALESDYDGEMVLNPDFNAELPAAVKVLNKNRFEARMAKIRVSSTTATASFSSSAVPWHSQFLRLGTEAACQVLSNLRVHEKLLTVLRQNDLSPEEMLDVAVVEDLIETSSTGLHRARLLAVMTAINIKSLTVNGDYLGITEALVVTDRASAAAALRKLAREGRRTEFPSDVDGVSCAKLFWRSLRRSLEEVLVLFLPFSTTLSSPSMTSESLMGLCDGTWLEAVQSLLDLLKLAAPDPAHPSFVQGRLVNQIAQFVELLGNCAATKEFQNSKPHQAAAHAVIEALDAISYDKSNIVFRLERAFVATKLLSPWIPTAQEVAAETSNSAVSEHDQGNRTKKQTRAQFARIRVSIGEFLSTKEEHRAYLNELVGGLDSAFPLAWAMLGQRLGKEVMAAEAAAKSPMAAVAASSSVCATPTAADDDPEEPGSPDGPKTTSSSEDAALKTPEQYFERAIDLCRGNNGLGEARVWSLICLHVVTVKAESITLHGTRYTPGACFRRAMDLNPNSSHIYCHMVRNAAETATIGEGPDAVTISRLDILQRIAQISPYPHVMWVNVARLLKPKETVEVPLGDDEFAMSEGQSKGKNDEGIEGATRKIDSKEAYVLALGSCFGNSAAAGCWLLLARKMASAENVVINTHIMSKKDCLVQAIPHGWTAWSDLAKLLSSGEVVEVSTTSSSSSPPEPGGVNAVEYTRLQCAVKALELSPQAYMGTNALLVASILGTSKETVIVHGERKNICDIHKIAVENLKTDAAFSWGQLATLVPMGETITINGSPMNNIQLSIRYAIAKKFVAMWASTILKWISNNLPHDHIEVVNGVAYNFAKLVEAGINATEGRDILKDLWRITILKFPVDVPLLINGESLSPKGRVERALDVKPDDAVLYSWALSNIKDDGLWPIKVKDGLVDKAEALKRSRVTPQTK